MKKKLFNLSLVCFLAIGFLCLPSNVSAQKKSKPKRAKVCGDPSKSCKTSVTFEAFDLPFEVPENVFIAETERFYAVILKSFRVTDDECESKFISEDERLAAQELFPNNKVFASRCPEPGNLFYEPIDYRVRFMAVFSGRTKAEATKMLAKVKATGQFSGAYIKQLLAGFNGT
jgi:hypothetical protein